MKRVFAFAATFVCGLAFFTTSSRADTVNPGYDLLQTQAGTTFMGVPLMGVPLGTYDFGGTIGVQNVGDADTVVQRTSAVTAADGGSGTTPLVMTALQMETAAPVSLGGGPVGNYFITLQSTHGGPATTGSMTINFTDNTGGTFNSFFDVFFDIHFGALNGPIVQQGDLPLTGSDNPWGRIPPAGAITIPGANQNLNGVDNTTDFWPGSNITEQEANVAVHVVSDALATPLPPAWVGGVALLGIIAINQWRNRKCAAC